MSDFAIRVEHLGKRYRIGRQRSYLRFSEMPLRFLSAANRLARRTLSRKVEEDSWFWALEDASFEIRPGEAVGIVGRNGAGKSTLLKLLSRITRPTRGSMAIRGRVGSLLEVGTGFHPELTGRENIFLNGTILGMRRAEIKRKFDEIVSFSEIERFLDTAVKHYSSGMFVRLAFAVAAHLEPEILLIDEVLAVGDAAFQKKCIGKMADVARSNRTILFVSHNMPAVRNLCTRAVWLDHGQVRSVGPTEQVALSYLREVQPCDSIESLRSRIARVQPDPVFRLIDFGVLQNGAETLVVGNGEAVDIEIVWQVVSEVHGLRVYFDLCDEDGVVLVRSFHDDCFGSVPVIAPGYYRSTAIIPPNLLASREYRLYVRAGIFNVRSCIREDLAVRLDVQRTTMINRAYPTDAVVSRLQPLIKWATKRQVIE